MWHNLKIYLILLPLFFFIDYLFLGKIMVGFYKQELGPLARRVGEDLSPLALGRLSGISAHSAGHCPLCPAPGVPGESARIVPLLGCLFGVVLYGIYDLTNLSMLAGWSLKLSLLDMAWGGVLCAISTTLAAYLDRWLG